LLRITKNEQIKLADKKREPTSIKRSRLNNPKKPILIYLDKKH